MKILPTKFCVATLVAVVTPGVAMAQVTQTYSYDANGRLTGVVTSSGGNTHTSAYTYDAANNRTSRSQTGVTTWAAVSQLPWNQLLQPDEALVSPDGHYSFALRSSGQLELWRGEAPVASDSQAVLAAFSLTDEGQARFLPSYEAADPSAQAWVSLRDDGALTLLDEAGRELWRSGAATGEEAAQ